MMGRIRIAIACMGVLLISAARARAQTTYRETGSVTIGGYLVWVRGTNASSVELFVGRGFRDAFARAHEMDAAKLQQWIDSVRAVAPVASDDTTSMDAHTRAATLGTDVTLMRRVGGTHSGLRLLVSGEEPIQMAEPTARDFIVMLDSASRVSLEMSKPGPSLMVGIPAPDVPVKAAPAMVVAAAPAPAPMPAPEPTPPAPIVVAPPPPPPPPPPPLIGVPTTTTVIGVRPDSIDAPAPARAPAPAIPMGPSTTDAPPELVLQAPAEPVILLASRVDIMPLPLPPVSIPAPKPVITSMIVPTDTAMPPHADVPADKLIRTPLGPFTVPGALIGDRDKEARYCYTQLGLKYNPDLKGDITLKLSLASDGTVQDAAVTKRSWQGISAGEVESCVRAIARDWTFASKDATIVDGATLLTFSFAP
ncbi:MAG TPA: hypothetical protein VGO46_01605 [Gemmatimonadaceae bacterium]|nr:hypothetical protein [Gemmatimonadaceae bacterium]